MRPIARNICYRHVHISTHVQWSIQISQPLALYVLCVTATSSHRASGIFGTGMPFPQIGDPSMSRKKNQTTVFMQAAPPFFQAAGERGSGGTSERIEAGGLRGFLLCQR